MQKLDEDSIIQNEVTHYHYQIPFKSSVRHYHTNQPRKDDDDVQQQSNSSMGKLHQMNKNHLTQSNEERLSTPNHVLSSLSSLDFSKKAGDNFNDLVGTRCWTWRPLVWKRIRHSMLKNLVVEESKKNSFYTQSERGTNGCFILFKMATKIKAYKVSLYSD